MACEIWGHGHRVDEAPEGTGRRKCSAKKMYADARLKAEVLSEVIEKKLVKPSRCKETAKRAVVEFGLSVRQACR